MDSKRKELLFVKLNIRDLISLSPVIENREYRRNRRLIIKVEEQPEPSEIEETESKQETQDVKDGREKQRKNSRQVIL